MPHYADFIRLAAVVAYLSANGNIQQATQVLEQLLGAAAYAELPRPDQFIRDQWQKYDRLHTVSDQYAQRAPSHQKLVPDDIISQCAAALKKGYIQQVLVSDEDGGLTETSVHRYYATIKEACKLDPFLSDVIRQFDVTPEYLLRRMHQVDPGLVRRTTEFKHDLSEEVIQERQDTAFELLRRWKLDKSLLLRTYWIDETTIWIITSHDRTHKVYCDAHDAGVRAVLTTPHISTKCHIKVHLFAAVNAIKGPCFYDFTTGTTEIQRRTPNMRDTYTVSHVYAPILATVLQPSSRLAMCCT
jgi:hypothetical protein